MFGLIDGNNFYVSCERAFDPIKSEKLMTALDAVNAKFGRGTLRPGGIRPVTPWSTRANNRSPRYTTRFSELMEVRA